MKCFSCFHNKKSLARVAFVFLLFITSCDGVTRLNGNITDEEGKPVADALVLMNVDGIKQESKSNAAGFYEINATHAPFKVKIKLTVSKESYQTYEQEFDSQEKLGRQRDIILIKVKN